MKPHAPSLLERRWRVGLFTTLYLYQGLVAGFATLAVANHFAASGADAGEVGRHLALVGLPWVLQPLLWGPLLDRASPRRMGARRFWLVLALLGAQASLCGLLALGPAPALTALSAVLFLHSLCASLADTATDRMLMLSVPESELGRTSACTRIGFVLGSALGAAVFAWLLDAAGFSAAVPALIGLTSLLALAAGVVRESPGDALFFTVSRGAQPSGSQEVSRPAPARAVTFARRLVRAFRTPEAALLLAMCFAIDFALSLFQVPFSVALVQTHGWDAAALSRVQAGLGLLGGTVGALAVGFLVDRTGPTRGLLGLLLACAFTFAAIAGLIAAGLEAQAGPMILGLSNVVPALLYVALLPTVVLASRARDVSATQFQIFMATMNLGDVAGAALAGETGRWLTPFTTACATVLVFLLCAGARLHAARRGADGA